MSWRPRATALVLAALALTSVVAFLPAASADHAYSHRFVIFGRVVDAENNPVPGLQISPQFSSVFERGSEGSCSAQPGTGTDAWASTATNPITNQYGEFFFCHHVHVMSRAEPGRVTYDLEGKQYTFDFDAFMRYAFTEIKLDAAHPNANKQIVAQQHTILGRAWESTGAADKSVEGVRVFGDTLHNKPVNITFTYNGKDPVRLNTTTNNYGDFAIRAPVTERPTEGTITVEVAGHFRNETVSPTGASFVRVQVGQTATSNIPAPAAALLVGLVALAALVLARRK